MKKNGIIKGTFILTIAGLATRLIGFFYRIFLSNALGTENLGVYQLVFPVYAICFTLYASGIQTAISQMVAAEQGRNKDMVCAHKRMKRILRIGMFFSCTIALCLSFLVNLNANFIAIHILLEPKCAGSLKVLSYVFPFCGITACINGYYIGLKRAGIPATTQLLEQVVRVVSVYVIALYAGGGNMQVTCELAMLGVVLGEIASNFYNIFSLLLEKKQTLCQNESNSNKLHTGGILKQLTVQAAPLTGNRLIISILHSFEAVLIPSMLRKSGLSNFDALSIYGILTGMSIPFILFPSTITNSLAILLLPTVSEAQAKNNTKLIEHTTEISIKYSLLLGILSTAVFILYGKSLGNIFFHNELAGTFLITLSWLCPFLYLSTTLSSIINGLGKTHLTFFNTIVGLAIRILFVLYLVPKQGISGYLIGMLISQLAIALLDYMSVHMLIHIQFNSVDWILKPGLIVAFVGFLIIKAQAYIASQITISALLLITLSCIVLSITYSIFLMMTKVIKRSDL